MIGVPIPGKGKKEHEISFHAATQRKPVAFYSQATWYLESPIKLTMKLWHNQAQDIQVSELTDLLKLQVTAMLALVDVTIDKRAKLLVAAKFFSFGKQLRATGVGGDFVLEKQAMQSLMM